MPLEDSDLPCDNPIARADGALYGEAEVTKAFGANDTLDPYLPGLVEIMPMRVHVAARADAIFPPLFWDRLQLSRATDTAAFVSCSLLTAAIQ